MEVVVMPPGVGGHQGYVISRDKASFAFATEEGNWVDFVHRYEAVQFVSAHDAIEFAEIQGWIVMNKKDGDSLIDVPRDRWL